MAGRIQGVTVAVVVIAVVCAVVPASTVAATTDPGNNRNPSLKHPEPAAQTPQDNSTSNQTSHHVNPSNATGEGSLLQVRGWLAGRLSGRLSNSAIQISQGQYQLGRSLIGEQYDSWLGQLVNVTGETASDEDDGLANTYADVRRTQRNFSTAASKYNQTLQQYQEAVNNGNESAARRYARQLQDIANRLQRLNRSLVQDYEQLGNRTGTNFTEAISSISTYTENVSSRQRRIEETLFIETDLRVTSDVESISYTDPLTASGRLVTEDDTPLSNRNITLQVGRQIKQVQTDSEGRFSLRYRPRTIPADTNSLSIRYVPRNESQYLGSNASLPVSIQQVDVNLTVTFLPSATSFGDRFEVRTRVTHNGEPVSGIPLEANIGTYRLDEKWTDSDGSGTLRGTIPASVPVGQQQVTVSLAVENRAVNATSVSVPVRVRSTDTTISVQGERVAGDKLRISGKLTTEGGLAAPNQTVQISIDQSVERTVETTPNGTYTLVLNQSALPAGTNTSARVTVAYDGQGTNLRSNSITEEITFAPLIANNGRSGGGDTVQPEEGGAANLGAVIEDQGVINIGVAILGIALGAGLIVLGWRYFRSQSSDEEDAQMVANEGESSGAEKPTQLDLSRGQSLVAESPDEAILWTYHRIRDYLSKSASTEDSDTHWEFYNKCRQQLDEDQLSTLRELIEAYEAVRFRSQPKTEFDIESVIEDIDSNRW